MAPFIVSVDAPFKGWGAVYGEDHPAIEDYRAASTY
jgi:hypothetical protein